MSDSNAERPALDHAPMPPLVAFALRTAIVVGAVTVALLVLVGGIFSYLDDMIDRRVAQMRQELAGRALWERVERQIDRAARSDETIPPDRQRKLLEDIHILVDRYRPFILEAETAFSAQPAVGRSNER